MDAFYASVETLDDPSLKGKTVIVGGGQNRGVVSAASYEARKYGVHSAMPIMTAKKLCPHGIFLPVRMSRYKEISQRVFAIFLRFTPLVEPISLDEAFLDITASKHLSGSAEEIAGQIKKLVFAETGLTISAGVATCKLIAKIASDFQKPDGLTVVEPGKEQAFLAPLPISKLWGVGKATQKNLALLGVYTIGDLAKLPPDLMHKKFGKHGIHLYQCALGLDDREVTPEHDIKSVGHEETFTNDLTALEDIYRELLTLAVKVGRRIRRYELTGKTITLKVKYQDFTQITRSLTLAKATSDNQQIFKYAKELMKKTRAGAKPIRLLGISLSNLENIGTPEQIGLFSGKKEKEKRTRLHKAVDTIVDKFGPDRLVPAALIKSPDKGDKDDEENHL